MDVAYDMIGSERRKNYNLRLESFTIPPKERKVFLRGQIKSCDSASKKYCACNGRHNIFVYDELPKGVDCKLVMVPSFL